MSQLSDKYVYECFGQPGSGKTTTANKLIAEEGFAKPPNTFSKWYRMGVVVKHPLVVGVWLCFYFKGFLAHQSFRVLRYNIAVFTNTLAGVVWCVRAPDGAYILEEGMLQRMLSNSDILLSEQMVRKLMRFTLISEKVYWVRRLPERNRYGATHPRAQLGEEYLESWLSNLIRNEQVIMKVLTLAAVDVIEES